MHKRFLGVYTGINSPAMKGGIFVLPRFLCIK